MPGIVYVPERHNCSPGWTSNGDGTLASPRVGTPEGAIWECECGKTWVATYPYRNHFAPTYLPEGRYARWRRRRRTR